MAGAGFRALLLAAGLALSALPVAAQDAQSLADIRAELNQLTADLQRAAANLDRSVGRNITWKQQASVDTEILPTLDEIVPPGQTPSPDDDP